MDFLEIQLLILVISVFLRVKIVKTLVQIVYLARMDFILLEHSALRPVLMHILKTQIQTLVILVFNLVKLAVLQAQTVYLVQMVLFYMKIIV